MADEERGLIPEAGRVVKRYGFENLKLNIIWCGYFDGNEKSKRVQGKGRLHYHHTAYNGPCAIEGVFRTEHITCLSKEEWQSVRELPAFRGDAMTWKCPRCGREFSKQNQDHYCVKPQNIDDYISMQDEQYQSVLREVRACFRIFVTHDV